MSARPELELSGTPALSRLLAATRRALLRQVLAYGIGTVLGAATLWLAFAFLADWGLRVPHAIRVLHGFGLAAVVTVFLWRDLLRPLARLPTLEGLALLHERNQPELRELLISAVQFQRGARPSDADPALMAAVVREAEARAAALTPAAVIDAEAPRARLLLGMGGITCLALLAWLEPLLARTFLERMFGGATAWPQRTHLVVALPGLDAATVERSRERLRVRLARGSDVAVLVTAEGVAPEEITLHFEGGRDLHVGPSGAATYRTLLQSVQEDLAFHATGGDDETGMPRVEVEVLEPPDVEGLALAVEPPAYAGMAPFVVFNQDVEVLEGSRVSVHVLPAPRAARGYVRFLPDGNTLDLEPAPFPRAPTAEDSAEPPTAGTEVGLAFACTADKTLGFRVELVDANGLTNPEPALYRIRVLEDRAPELTVLAPARSEFETVPGGAVPLRVRVEDDFALASLGWRVRASEGSTASTEAPPLLAGELVLERPAAALGRARGARAARDTALGGARLELDALGTPSAPVSVDARFELEFIARDQRAPEPNEGRSPSVRVRVVTPEELLRRLQDRLASARLDALRLFDDQRKKRARVEELLDALDGDAPLAAGEDLAIAAALAGERRVLADAQALARSLAAAAEDVLYARLDDKAAGLLEFYDVRARQALDARFQAAPWRELARESAGGALTGEGFAATLVRLVALSLEISEDHAQACVSALDTAEKAAARTAVADALQDAAEHAARVEQRLEALLSELAEWDNFQNVLTLARDILNRQKALRDRTQQFATDK
jgi:hypothetical protein